MRQLKITPTITRRDGRSLDCYLQDIGRIPLLTLEDEVLLFEQIKNGDQRALEKVVTANLRFVVSVAKQYNGQGGLPLEDLINEGNIGLITAVKKFDISRGFKFISYAVWWIRQSIMLAIFEKERLITLPMNQVQNVNRIKNIRDQFFTIHGYEPTAEDIAAVSNLSMGKIENVEMFPPRNHTSLSEPVKNDDETTSLLNVLEDEQVDSIEDAANEESRNAEIGVLLQKILKGNYYNVTSLYFGINVAPEERSRYLYSKEKVAQKLGLTKERVRQILERSILRLRQPKFKKAFESCL